MSTEVVHGPAPKFRATLTPGTFAVTITGHRTDQPNLGAAGATQETWDSTQAGKRLAELLVLRTAFLEWFVERYEDFGGTPGGAVEQLYFIVDGLNFRLPPHERFRGPR